jgi:hypothetical protein
MNKSKNKTKNEQENFIWLLQSITSLVTAKNDIMHKIKCIVINIHYPFIKETLPLSSHNALTNKSSKWVLIVPLVHTFGPTKDKTKEMQ